MAADVRAYVRVYTACPTCTAPDPPPATRPHTESLGCTIPAPRSVAGVVQYAAGSALMLSATVGSGRGQVNTLTDAVGRLGCLTAGLLWWSLVTPH